MMESKDETLHDILQDEQIAKITEKSADDILNELFSELGSKPLNENDSDGPASKSSKKKKKHKDKGKVKTKEKSSKSSSSSKKDKHKSEEVDSSSSTKEKKKHKQPKEEKKHKQPKEEKKHKSKDKSLKKSTSHNEGIHELNIEDHDDHRESSPKPKKRKVEKSPSPTPSDSKSSSHRHHHKSSKSSKDKPPKEKGPELDLEEGEILEKEKKHKKEKHEKSSKHRHHHSKSHHHSPTENYDNDGFIPLVEAPVDADRDDIDNHRHHSRKRSHSRHSESNRDSYYDKDAEDIVTHRRAPARSPEYNHHKSDSDRYGDDEYNGRSPDRHSSSRNYNKYDRVDDRSSDYRYSDERISRSSSKYKDDYRDRDKDSDYRRSSSSSSYHRSSHPYNNGSSFSHRSSYRSSYRPRSRSRSRHPSDIIDKAKLLEIARRNATLLMKQGVLPTDIFSRDQIMAIKAGGKSVEELTSYCRKLARSDGAMDEASGGEGSDGGEKEEEHFIHHPFVVKERPMPQITLNIRNAIPLPVRTPQELAIENAVRKTQFPVSSGCQHRFKELEWKVVEKDDEKDKDKKPGKEDTSKALVPLPPVGTATPIMKTENEAESSASADNGGDTLKKNLDTGIALEPMLPQVDISSVISVRLKAMRTLKENPNSEEAKQLLESAVVEMNHWAQAKALEPKFLTTSELQSGPQAWAKRDQLKNAKEVASGMGMHLLQKMGWRPGEGLGKNKEGTTEPLALDVKTDKKGLMSQADLKQKGPQANVSMLYDLAGKHPVSALMELCTKRRWGPPSFELCFEHGPAHQKQFVYKVIVNGVEYQPCVATNNKKLAKANAAAFCLQSLGLLKTNPAPAPSETLQTVPANLPPVVEPAAAAPSSTFVQSSSFLQTVPSNPQ